MADSYVVELLQKKHQRADFDCGNTSLNAFLQKHAGQNARANVSRTYVVVKSDNLDVLGYFTLAMSHVHFDVLPEKERKKLPKYPIPVVLLGRLAVTKTGVGLGLGKRLLVEALERAYRASHDVGAAAVEVDAKDETARAFYLKYGFTALLDDEQQMWLSMKTVAKLIG